MQSLNATTHRKSSTAMNVLTAGSGLTVLVGCLVALDVRIRDQVNLLLTGQSPTGEVGIAVASARDAATLFVEALRDQSLAYAPLTIFGLAAIVLVLFMTRT